ILVCIQCSLRSDRFDRSNFLPQFRYVSRSEAEEAIGGLTGRISAGQKLHHKVFRLQLLTYRPILSTASQNRERTPDSNRPFLPAMLFDWL
ncbi:hypothetical protein, partial [uncultured Ellagibacter sp.]|uniref:hypothetical protein n=1 Tax=uncultured Ellagibacter sp. TaxID=2137580 RepID=UPI0025D9BB18